MLILARSRSLLMALLLVWAGLTSPASAKLIYIVAIVPPDTAKVYITGDDATLGSRNPRAVS